MIGQAERRTEIVQRWLETLKKSPRKTVKSNDSIERQVLSFFQKASFAFMPESAKESLQPCRTELRVLNKIKMCFYTAPKRPSYKRRFTIINLRCDYNSKAVKIEIIQKRYIDDGVSRCFV